MGVNDEINSPTASEFDFTYDINSSPHDKFSGSKEGYRLLNAAKQRYYDEKARLELIEWDRKEKARKEYERAHPKKGIEPRCSVAHAVTQDSKYNPTAYGKYYNPVRLEYNREEYENDDETNKKYQPQEQAVKQTARVYRSSLTEEESEAYYQEWKRSLDLVEPPPTQQLKFYWQDNDY